MAWHLIRSLAAAAVDTPPPAPSVFIGEGDQGFTTDGGLVAYVEVDFRSLSLSAGSAVTFGVWRLGEGVVSKLGTVTIASADLAYPQPAIFEAHGEALYVTVDAITGGGTVTGSIYARPVRL